MIGMNQAQQQLMERFGRHGHIDCHGAVIKPTVSIIIPSYNCLSYLPDAIRSAQSQTIADIEILIFDDDSSDETWQYLMLAAQCDLRIKPHKLTGVGVAKARNCGLRLAQSHYIAFLDADDRWEHQKLARQLAFHQQHPEVLLSFCNYQHINEQGEDLGYCFDYWPMFKRLRSKLERRSKGDAYQLIDKKPLAVIFAENVIGTSTVMLSRDGAGASLFFDEQIKSAEDWEFWLRVASRGAIGFSNRVDMIYLMRVDSESSKTEFRLQYMQTIIGLYFKAVFRQSPVACMRGISRLLTAYAEKHREICGQGSPVASESSVKSCVYHFIAFLCFPSKRAFRAMLADIKHLLS